MRQLDKVYHMLIHAIVDMGMLSSMVFYRKYVCGSNAKIRKG